MFTAPPNAVPGMMIQVDVPADAAAAPTPAQRQAAAEAQALAQAAAAAEAQVAAAAAAQAAAEAAAADRLQRFPLDWVGTVLTPSALLDAERPAEFVQLLNVLAEAPLDRLADGDIESYRRASTSLGTSRSSHWRGRRRRMRPRRSTPPKR